MLLWSYPTRVVVAQQLGRALSQLSRAPADLHGVELCPRTQVRVAPRDLHVVQPDHAAVLGHAPLVEEPNFSYLLSNYANPPLVAADGALLCGGVQLLDVGGRVLPRKRGRPADSFIEILKRAHLLDRLVPLQLQPDQPSLF